MFQGGIPLLEPYYKKNKRLFDSPEPGDQIFFYPKDGIGGSAISHTGLVYDVGSDQCEGVTAKHMTTLPQTASADTAAESIIH